MSKTKKKPPLVLEKPNAEFCNNKVPYQSEDQCTEAVVGWSMCQVDCKEDYCAGFDLCGNHMHPVKVCAKHGKMLFNAWADHANPEHEDYDGTYEVQE